MHWMLDRWSLAKSKEEDLKYVSEADYVKIRIWFCHCKIHTEQNLLYTNHVYSNSKISKKTSITATSCGYSICIF